MKTPRRIAVAAAAIFFLAGAAVAQDSKREAQLRTVRGVVRTSRIRRLWQAWSF